MRLPFGLSAYSRADGRLASVRLVNFYVEQSPTSPGGTVAIPRPGLSQYMNQSVRGLYREDGVFDGDVFTVSGAALYRAGASLGAVAGIDRPEWAYTVDGLFVLTGGIVYQTNGVTIETDPFPDGALVASITQINSILVAVRADTGTVYFRLPGDTAWNALDFFSAERRPDPALAVRVLGDFLYVFGSSTIEAFSTTDDTAVPFIRIDGVSINRGIKDRDAICQLDNTLFFVGEDNIVYRMENIPSRISDHGIEERVRRSNTARAFSYTWDGHTFMVLGLDTETIVYDVAGGWATYTLGDAPFPSLGLYDGENTFIGGAKVWLLDEIANDDGVAMERVFTAVIAAEGPVACNALQISLSPGVTNVSEEPAVVQMRWSDDQGRRWTDWKEASSGFSGQYRKRVIYRRLGMADAPGRLFEVRQTDDVLIRYSGCDLNPPGGGRSRG